MMHTTRISKIECFMFDSNFNKITLHIFTLKKRLDLC